MEESDKATLGLASAEKYKNVHLHFGHKLVTADLNQGLMTFERQENKEMVIESADLVVGADGAYSMARKQLMKQPMFNYSQTYIEHGYLELCIPPDEKGQHKMEKNFLHIWPRGKFMMIALPNQDGSWTVTLFMPFPVFASLDTPTALLAFFQQHYSDAVPLLGEDRLVRDFFATKPSPLVSIKCNPYHIGKSAIIIGDAAHAMVPFYGQGMNAGFEDCTLLDEMMMKHHFDLDSALKEFSILRNPDAEAICDLAMYNYVEMRDLVNHRSFILRKKLDTFLHWLAPNFWIPLYTSVTFSHMRYSDCIKNRKWQDKVISRTLIATGVFMFAGLTMSYLNWQERIEDAYHSAITRLQTQYW
ncbi:hypothetical protein B566_EDAN007443 [Ephemera danica]|nr:hypothetical protein B566_EDAN007443 [Ephemera danica]